MSQMFRESRNSDDPLRGWRERIDALDAMLLDILAQRSRIVREIGAFKQAQGLPPLDPERWCQVQKSMREQAKKLDLPPAFVEELYELIHQHSLALESQSEDSASWRQNSSGTKPTDRL